MVISLKQYVELFIKYLKPLRFKILQLTALVIACIGLQLVNPLIIRAFIDAAVGGKNSQQLFLIALSFLGLSLLLQVIMVATTYISENVGWQATNWLRADLLQHCLQLDMSFHNEHTPGEMIERIDGDVTYLARVFSLFVARVLSNSLLVIGVLLVMVFEDWHIGLAFAVYTLVVLICLTLLRRIAVPYWQSARQISADLFGFLEEQLSSTEDISANGAGSYVLQTLLGFNRTRLDKELDANSMNTFPAVMWIGFYTLAQATIFILCYTLFREKILTIGSVYLIVYYNNIIIRPLRQIVSEVQNLQKAAASVQRIKALFARTSKIKDGARNGVSEGPLAITFNDVTYGYVATEPILQNVTFHLPAGKVLGLLGRTGCGKTTLTRLVFRLYDPMKGQVCLHVNGDNVDIREITLGDLRQHVGMVTQDVQLFCATVRDNLTFFSNDIPDDKIVQVIQEMGLSDWYTSLPKGLDTELGSRGGGLSGGEAQLLAFTRVFLKNPGLVILDEASSRLDPATEKLVEHGIDRLLEGRTVIMIAHRLHTVHRADYIMILEDGVIRELGKYDELARNSASRFYSLLQTDLQEVLA